MNTADNRNLIKVVVAGDVSTERVSSIARTFAKDHNIVEYSVESQSDDSIMDGFVIYYKGERFDFSVKGQFDRISQHIKRSREGAQIKKDVANTKEEIKRNIQRALNEFDEKPATSITEISFDSLSNSEEIGIVESVSDSVAMVEGLEYCMSSELVVFANGAYGIAMNLEPECVGVVLLSEQDSVVEGMICKRTGDTVSVPVGMGLLGRVVDPLGQPIDGKGVIRYSETRHIESTAPSIIERSPVNKPLLTGITAIDALTPIGRGQRELIIGDRQTGKTAIAIDTIINQKGKDCICVYVAIGQKMSTIVSIVNLLEKYGALEYTVIVAASSSQTASVQYIAPYSGCAIAEKFMFDDKKDVLIVYDDLSKHAQAYRAISLLLRRPPGREAYPGDVFYLHSRLLERAVKLSPELGGASITALPIIETLGGDISAYIPTNVISITDGQIYLEPELFFSGQRPAINVGLSVSRVGGAAQTKATKKVGGPLRIALAQAREMASFAQFGSDLDENTQLQLKRGVVLNEVLKQEQYSPRTMEEQVVILYMATTDKMNFLVEEDIKEYYTEFIDYVRVMKDSVLDSISDKAEFTKDISDSLDMLLEQYKEKFLSEHQEYRD